MADRPWVSYEEIKDKIGLPEVLEKLGVSPDTKGIYEMIKEATRHDNIPEQPMSSGLEGKVLFTLNLDEEQRLHDLFCKLTRSRWKKWLVSIFGRRDLFGVTYSELVNEALNEAVRVLTNKYTYNELCRLHESGQLNEIVTQQLRQPGALLVKKGVLHVGPDPHPEDLMNGVKVQISKVHQARNTN